MRLHATKYLAAIGLVTAALAGIWLPALRHGVLYSVVPLCCIGCAAVLCSRYIMRGSNERMLVLLTAMAACFHAYNYAHYGVRMEFDSKEYFSLAQGIAAGSGLSHTVYRTPLYPALVGLFLFAGDRAGLYFVLLQHALAVLCVPAVYAAARLFGFSQRASCIAAAFIALNALLAQAAGYVMTEILFCSLALVSLAMLVRFMQSPSIARSVSTGAAFAAAAYCRPILFPVLACGLALLWIKKGKPGVTMAMLCLGVYFGATAPWCLRNYSLSGHYAMSASLGVQAFTKAITFKCLNEQGPYYASIEAPLRGVMKDLGITRGAVASIPEDDWQTNRIPHALMDSLTTRHGFSYFFASELLRKTAFEGFIKHLARYGASIAHSLVTMLFSFREIHPSVAQLAPINPPAGMPMVQRLLSGLVHVSGYCILLFPLAALFRREKNYGLFVPFAMVCGMYFLTAAIQIGFTRYTIPWLPFTAMCGAYVVETILVYGKKSTAIAVDFVKTHHRA